MGLFNVGDTEWAAADYSPDGRFVAVSVRDGSRGSPKPKVIACTQSSKVAIGHQALAELARTLSTAKRWTLPLARTDYQILVLPEPPVLESEMEQSLRWLLGSMIDFPVDEASVGWMRIPTAELQPGHEKQVYAIVARKSVVTQQAELFEKAGLPLKAVDVRENALRNIAGLLEQNSAGIGLVTLGHTGVTTTFTFRGELYLDRFVSQSLDELLQADEDKRHKFFERIAQQVHQSMDLLTRTHPFITVQRIVVAPLPAPMDLVEFLVRRLPVPVEALKLESIFDISSTPELSDPASQARYLVALGAALRGSRKLS